MVTDELLAYIQTQRNKNTPQELIIARLLQAGWLKADIDEALSKASVQSTPPVAKPLDPYRELPTETLEKGEVVKITQPIMVTPKIEPVVFSPAQTRTPIEQKVEHTPAQQPIVEKPIEKIQTPVAQTPQVAPIEPKIWTPMRSMPIEPTVAKVESQPLEIAQAPATQEQATHAPISRPKEIPVDVSKIAPSTFTVVGEPVVQRKTQQQPTTQSVTPVTQPPVISTIVSQVAHSPLSPVMPESMKDVSANAAVVHEVAQAPTTEQKPAEKVQTPIGEKPITMNPFVQKTPEIPTIEIKPTPKSTLPISNMPVQTTADMLSHNAMLATYAQDIDTSKDTNVLVHHRSNFKKLGIIILILCALFGVAYGFMAGYMSVPSFLKFSLVKKDPKELLANNRALLASHNSYKADTTITLSTPAVANITSGLMNGTQVVSRDTDSVSLSLATKVGTTGTSRIYDTALHLSSSLLKNDIISNVTYDGANAYVAVPQLAEILGDTAPTPATVALPQGHFGVLSRELPAAIEDVIGRVDVYDIASKGIPPFVKTEIESSFADFVNGAQITDKGTEVIGDTMTYHYIVTPDRQMTKKFLNDVLGVFITTLSPGMKQNVDEALGSVRFDDFDVWVGKGDGMIHQYKVTLIAPLSKVIALDDKGIAGNVVRFSIVTNYYDIDVPNKVAIPTNAVTAEDFAKTMHDAKIQSSMKSFKNNATILSHADGGYGKVANTVGSCASPKVGSLFSPVGHSKGASSAVGMLAQDMNTILGLSGQAGSCFSTPQAWAFAVPKTADPSSSYCVDSKDTSTILTTPLSGTVCK